MARKKAPVKLRPVVQAFAEAMEEELQKNDYKGGWWDDHPRELLSRVVEELAELVPLVSGDKLIVPLLEIVADRLCDESPHSVGPDRPQKPRRIRSEAADVANMVMMVADAARALKEGQTIGHERGDEAANEEV